MNLRACLLASILAACGGAFPIAANAQSFPQQQVTIIVPFAVGTGPDAVMRMVSEKLSKWWGQPVIVDNKPGSRAFVAMEAAKRAPPTGHTLVQVDPGIIALASHLYKAVPYDPVKDYVPVVPMYKTNFMVTVAADAPWKTLPEFLAAAKQMKDGATYGSAGIGTLFHIGSAWLAVSAGATMTHVPYKDVVQIYTDIGRGEITWAFGTIATTRPMLQAKKVKYLAVSGLERDPLYPDVPTVAEATGFADFDFRTWLALYAPANTPRAAIARINADVTKALQEPDVLARLSALGAVPWTGSPEVLADAQRKASESFATLVKRINISLD